MFNNKRKYRRDPETSGISVIHRTVTWVCDLWLGKRADRSDATPSRYETRYGRPYVTGRSIHYTVRSSGSLGKHYVEVHTKEMLFTSVTFQSQERAGFWLQTSAIWVGERSLSDLGMYMYMCHNSRVDRAAWAREPPDVMEQLISLVFY